MLDVLLGFWTMTALVLVGWLLARLETVPISAVEVLTTLAFRVATPLLLFTVVARAPLEQVLSPLVPIAAVTALTVGLLAVALTRRPAGDRGVGEAVVVANAAGYVNSTFLGIPIAVFVLGDAVWATPVILAQVLFLQPLALAVLDSNAGVRPSGPVARVWQVVGNPLTLASLSGVLVSGLGWDLPPVVAEPVGLLGDMAVPTILLAYGMSLRWGPRPFSGGDARELWTVVALKVLLMPLLALLAARGLGLEQDEVLAAVVGASLPTAQNVFMLSTVYRTRQDLARDAVFASTLLTVPVVLFVVALLG
ncbi:AEC family transporter [Kytococcus sp. Marseille-QA3725]